MRSLLILLTALACATLLHSVAFARTADLHLYFCREIVLKLEQTGTPGTFSVTVLHGPKDQFRTYERQYPYTPLAQYHTVDHFTLVCTGEREMRTYHLGDSQYDVLYWYDGGAAQLYPHIDVQFDLSRNIARPYSRNTMRFMVNAADFVFFDGDSTSRSIYEHYDRSQNVLPIPRPPFRTGSADHRLTFNGYELVPVSDEAYARLNKDSDSRHKDNIPTTTYEFPHGWFNSGGPATVHTDARKWSPKKAASEYLGVKFRGLRLFEHHPGNYAIDNFGVIRTMRGTSPTDSIVGFLDPVTGVIYRGMPNHGGTEAGRVDRQSRIWVLIDGGWAYRCQVDFRDHKIFGPQGEVVGYARPIYSHFKVNWWIVTLTLIAAIGLAFAIRRRGAAEHH